MSDENSLNEPRSAVLASDQTRLKNKSWVFVEESLYRGEISDISR